MEIILIGIPAIFFSLGTAFVIISFQEGEPKAALRSTWITLAGTAILLSSLALPPRGDIIFLGSLLGVGLISFLLFYFPIVKKSSENSNPQHQVDEREIIFARAHLVPGTPEYETYYRSHPHHKEQDDASRNKPGLLSPDAAYTDPLHSAAAGASFFLTDALREAVDGPVAEEKIQSSQEDLTQTVKYLATYYGALDCGITVLKSSHIYSHIGRGSGVYGAPVELHHQFAIALTVEMDFQMTGSALTRPSPWSPGGSM
ncbi:MAG: hypothetical protein MUO54_07685 [Anaerolineales bacterium]|nr:hypothetical protein [Anaerolineales bacterium]